MQAIAINVSAPTYAPYPAEAGKRDRSASELIREARERFVLEPSGEGQPAQIPRLRDRMGSTRWNGMPWRERRRLPVPHSLEGCRSVLFWTNRKGRSAISARAENTGAFRRAITVLWRSYSEARA